MRRHYIILLVFMTGFLNISSNLETLDDPKVILCDEPTANLDRENSLRFIDTIQDLHKAGKTIVVATHDPLFEHLPFESRVIHMEDGVIGSGGE